MLFTLIGIKVNPRIYTILGLLYARRGRYMQELLESSRSFWNIGKEYEIYVYWYLHHDCVFDQLTWLIDSIDKVVGSKLVFMTTRGFMYISCAKVHIHQTSYLVINLSLFRVYLTPRGNWNYLNVQENEALFLICPHTAWTIPQHHTSRTQHLSWGHPYR